MLGLQHILFKITFQKSPTYQILEKPIPLAPALCHSEVRAMLTRYQILKH